MTDAVTAASAALLVTTFFMAPKLRAKGTVIDNRLTRMLDLLVSHSELSPTLEAIDKPTSQPLQLALNEPGRVSSLNAFGRPVSVVNLADVRGRMKHCLLIGEKPPARKGERRFSLDLPAARLKGEADFTDEETPKLKRLALSPR